MKKSTGLDKKLQTWETLNSSIAGLPSYYTKNGFKIFSDGFGWCISSEKHGKYAKTYKSLEKAIDFAESKM